MSIFGGASMKQGAKKPSVQEYYSALESRVGYKLFLSNRRHCGLWPEGTIWPFPISRALQAMEDRIHARLGLRAGSKVLDAGCGSGKVAISMAGKGLQVTGIDLTPHHVRDAKRNIMRLGLEGQVTILEGDYHDLCRFPDNFFDGVYTMETFVHANDPVKVLRNFYRVLKPGGVLVMHEAEFKADSALLQDILRLSHCQNTLRGGSCQHMLAEVGFQQTCVEDLTANVFPLWRMLGLLGAVPYDFLRIFGVQRRFVNLMAAVEIYRHWDDARYISLRAVKASGESA